MIPAFRLARTDQRLHAIDVRVYAVLLDELDLGEPRRVKQIAIALALKIEQSTVSRSLNRLAETGYLIEGPPDGRRRTYCLAYQNRSCAAA